MARTPFPVPFGWYQVCWPDELEPGGVAPLYLFGRDLVLWRDTEAGSYHLQDAICPHLGGHLGHGGHVEDCEIQCPFHGWRFDARGRNSDIPYSEKVNRAARLRTYPVLERNGIVLAWYHPFEAEPLWDVPVIDEFSDDDGWSATTTRMVEIPAAWQEIAENSVDLAHFRYLHNTESVPEARSYETDGPIARVRTVQKFVTLWVPETRPRPLTCENAGRPSGDATHPVRPRARPDRACRPLRPLQGPRDHRAATPARSPAPPSRSTSNQ